MKQNIFDNEKFFKGYIELRSNPDNWNDNLEIPVFRSILPELSGKKILDIGCGFGDNCKYFAGKGAEHVTGIDISEKMVALANEKNPHSKITYQVSAIEDYDFPAESFDLVVSSLAFHYVEDFDSLIKKIHISLTKNGYLVFSIEHPVVTSNIESQDWVTDETGKKIHWAVKNYFTEGKREYEWFVKGVTKYHRRLDSIFNSLIDSGFKIERVTEPEPIHIKTQPEIPSYLMISALKL